MIKNRKFDDPQEAKAVARCLGCMEDIYEGETVYVVNGDLIHADYYCLMKYVDPKIKTVTEALGLE